MWHASIVRGFSTHRSYRRGGMPDSPQTRVGHLPCPAPWPATSELVSARSEGGCPRFPSNEPVVPSAFTMCPSFSRLRGRGKDTREWHQ